VDEVVCVERVMRLDKCADDGVEDLEKGESRKKELIHT
jgi:hypothetical protein